MSDAEWKDYEVSLLNPEHRNNKVKFKGKVIGSGSNEFESGRIRKEYSMCIIETEVSNYVVEKSYFYEDKDSLEFNQTYRLFTTVKDLVDHFNTLKSPVAGRALQKSGLVAVATI